MARAEWRSSGSERGGPGEAFPTLSSRPETAILMVRTLSSSCVICPYGPWWGRTLPYGQDPWMLLMSPSYIRLGGFDYCFYSSTTGHYRVSSRKFRHELPLTSLAECTTFFSCLALRGFCG
ncbi:hypothetical protein ROHU_011016 [Labeo rohita]|uniref:Uncharacterized protein n=1 Tax=Labeo rohita TaxID=84645 RepID=A0A498LMY0_LABRO|nr:hypothetical protein ROHU_011016 [Labeo rohita]